VSSPCHFGSAHQDGLIATEPQVQAAIASAASAASGPEAEQDARQTADVAARGVARATWYSFAALVVGAIIALVSGSAGFRHQPPFEEGGGSAGDGDRLNETTQHQARPVQRPL